MIPPEGLAVTSTNPFKGNFDVPRLRTYLAEHGPEAVSFVRMEAGTNLIGGQPFSLANQREVYAVCREYAIPLVLDASLLADNLYFMKVREAQCAEMSIPEITQAMAEACDILYFSAASWGSAAVAASASATNRCTSGCVAWCRCMGFLDLRWHVGARGRPSPSAWTEIAGEDATTRVRCSSTTWSPNSTAATFR